MGRVSEIPFVEAVLCEGTKAAHAVVAECIPADQLPAVGCEKIFRCTTPKCPRTMTVYNDGEKNSIALSGCCANCPREGILHRFTGRSS